MAIQIAIQSEKVCDLVDSNGNCNSNIFEGWLRKNCKDYAPDSENNKMRFRALL